MKSLMYAASAFALLAAASCAKAGEEPKDKETADLTANSSVELPTYDEAGLDLSGMDAATKPGDDFYRYVHGTWLDTYEIPADKTRVGAFTILRDLSEERVKGIIEDLAEEKPAVDTLEGKIAAYYNAYLDTETIEARGLEPVKPYLDKIAAAETVEDLAVLFGSPEGYASPLGGWVDVDSKQTDRYIVYVNQSGLGLPDRDYYLKDDEKSVTFRAAYLKYITFLLEQAGYEDPAGAAQSVLDLETKIAEAQWDRTLGRDRDLTYNLVTREELEQIAGDFPVAAMLDAGGMGEQTEFVLRQMPPTEEELAAKTFTPEMVANLNKGLPALMELAVSEPMESWKAYLTARYISSNASVLPKAIDDASFEMYGKTLSGQQEQRERWKRAVGAVENSLGEGVGKVYAAKYFPPENKAAMEELVENLRKAMSENLTDLTWMGEETKVQARDKLAKFTPKIGYPEKFETYETLTVEPGKAFENALAAGIWGYEDMIGNLGQPIDKTEWFMLPQTVNAYYSPNRNEIVFPAAILQPPFFNISADPAVNYGAIGAVIGHEMGHGFDDQGAKSDGDGVLRDWWTPDDKAAFETLTGALVEQYNSFCPFGEDEKCVNGKLTLGENIGDLGGLSMAYRAYQISLDTNGDGVVSEDEQAPVINGLTGDQRFFISWAQAWQAKYRKEAALQQLQTDPHSPPYYRVNGIVRNFDEWYEAFDVQPGDALYLPPEERIRIW